MWQDLSIKALISDLMTLTLNFYLLFKNFNIGHILWMVSDKTFIFPNLMCSL
jgi:hypothetical protein